MCGIFGVVGTTDKAAKQVFNGLKDIEYRGYDSWGVAWYGKNGLVVKKNVGFLPVTLNLPSAKVAIGHTRWATHGGVTVANAHPHIDCHNQLALVHNGIVENYLDIKAKLKNHKFKSETDTEVIVHAIEEEYSKSQNLTEAVDKVFNSLTGLSAIVVTDGKKIVAARVGSPLVAGKTKEGFMIASDPNALLPYTHDLLFLEDSQLIELDDQINLYNAKSFQKLQLKFTKVEWQHSSSNLQNFPHFMLKEIYEQPQVIRNVLTNAGEAKKVAEMVKVAFGTYFIACGTASYACLLGTYLFSKYAKKHVNFSIGSEFNYLQDFLTDKSLLIAVSQSGESIDTLEPVVSAKKRGTKIVSLVNVLGSSLYRVSDHPVLLSAGVEKAVASTKAMIAMVSYMILISYILAGKASEATEALRKSISEVESLLKRKDQIKYLSEKIHQAKDMYILGRGLSYAVALESALKIKEVSYIHAEGFAGGELKHGTIALIEKGTPVIVYVPDDETKEASISNAMEVKARGAFVIGVGCENNPVFDYFFEVKDTGASSVIPHVVFAQLLAYFLTIKLGHNPDKPRNLAKSVVVR